MKQLLGLMLFVGLAAGLTWFWVESRKPTPPAPVATAPPAPAKNWTPEEIAKDPEGYLVWSDGQIQKQIDERTKRLAALADRQNQIVTRQKELQTNLDDVENIRNRMSRAYRQAEDEDRWPVRMGGRTFDRTKSKAIIDQTAQYLEDRRPLLAEYDKAMQKMNGSSNALKNDIANLGRMRERLALDLEKVRLKQGMEELDQLRETEAELAAMSKTLSTISEDNTADLLKDEPKTQTVDVDSLLK